MLWVGVDVGGTFTDIVAYDPSTGDYRVQKVSTTPANPAVGILNGLDVLQLQAGDIERFAHGTTITTNAVIQKKTARVGLITTKGFIDILHFRRTNRGDLYDIQWDPPAPLVPRRQRLGVSERIAYSGEVIQPIDLDEVRSAARQLAGDGCEAIAVCFLNSYVNPAHEFAAKDAIHGELGDVYVSISAEVLPEWREFERTSTTVINAATGPLLRRYLADLREKLAARGYAGEAFVMLSSGGLSTTTVASHVAAQTLESGPAAGVIAQRIVAAQMGIKNLVGLDMGGTSTDTSLILDGDQQVRPHQEVEFGAVVSLPSVDINSIGAGGGSIARVDKAGGLNVGPDSAGADPGPACYGIGGTEPTVTDANLVLGRLGASSLLGGRLPLDPSLAKRAVEERIAKPLGISTVEAAYGVIEVAVHNMVNAVHLMTVERGLDPRQFVLFGYGGAGPMHAAAIAKELSMERVVIPPHPGNTSAMGLLMADVRHDFVRTVLQHSDRLDYVGIEAVFRSMEEAALSRLQLEGIQPTRMQIVRSADLRYWGQTHDLTVPVPDGLFDSQTMAKVRRTFDEGHAREFWHSEPLSHPFEVVNLRVTGYGLLEKFAIPERGTKTARSGRPSEHRPVHFGREAVSTPVFDKEALCTEVRLLGPAIVEQLDSTTVVLPNQQFMVDRFDNLIIELS